MYLSISLSWENISMIFMWIWDTVSFWYLSQTRIMFGISDQLQVLEPFQLLVNTIQYHFVSSGDGLTNLLNSYPKQPFTKWGKSIYISQYRRCEQDQDTDQIQDWKSKINATCTISLLTILIVTTIHDWASWAKKFSICRYPVVW